MQRGRRGREFMKRALQHLGVVKDQPGRRQPGARPARRRRPARSTTAAKIKVGKRLRADRKGRVKVRVACDGDAGATCKGKVQLLRKRSKALGRQALHDRAPARPETVKVKLTKSAFSGAQAQGRPEGSPSR